MNTLRYVVIFGLLIAGCQKEITKKDAAVPASPKLVAVPNDIVPAVERVGGLKAWANTQVIAGECTYTIFNDDGTKYVTTQRHGVYPWSDTIHVYANEPQGKYAWSLFRDDFRALQSPGVKAKELPRTIGDRYIIEAIWSILAPPARIAALASADTRLCAPVVIDGLWYNPIKLPADRIYYLNKSNGIITMCLIPAPKGKFYLARGYDYRPIAQMLISEPAKIEIFESDVTAKPLKRIVEIDYFKQNTLPF